MSGGTGAAQGYTVPAGDEMLRRFWNKYASAVRLFAGLPEDTCALQGCTVPAGYQALNVPASGFIKGELFTQVAMAS